MRPRILVVDDDQLVADTLKLVFAVNGFDSEARYSAATGMERARSFAPELVLCDVTMPEENGLQLVEKLQSELPNIRVLMFSAFAGSAARVEEHATRTGKPLRLISKPCRPEELLHECNTLLKTA